MGIGEAPHPKERRSGIKKMKTKIIIIIAILSLSAITVLAQEGSNQVASLIAEIVSHAGKNDTAYFTPKMDAHYAGKEKSLIAMIQRSGIETNYVGRYTLNSNGTGNLNYHYLERGCNFQIDLIQTKERWTIKRIWFCR